MGRRSLILLGVVATAVTAAVVAERPPAAAAAGTVWCGTTSTRDRPATVAGHQIRVVYAYPSDGIDRSADLAPAISDDVDAIAAWWAAQDPTRTPRFDLASFACGPQVDLTVVRLPRPGAELVLLETRADRIIEGLPDAQSRYLTFLVLYDGPVQEADVCGQGGGDVSEPGVGIVYLQACAAGDRRVVAAHELGHALGAIATEGPPHPCEDDNGHPCDSELDLMHPTIASSDLFALTLDVGRDDYYGHSGVWGDVQDSVFLQWLDRQTRLTVRVRGQGTVVSDIPGVQCASACTSEWNTGARPSLLSSPAKGYRLVRWEGDCARATAGSCSLTLNGDRTATAVFGAAVFRLSVSVSGKGRVTSSPGGLSCPARCARTVASFSPVRLVARPAPGWRLRAWTGACRGKQALCVVPMTKATAARAAFVRV